ncbi:MAG: 5-formyltetrahydrofolate cyclo-ligase [Clostridia bacterium]|nr:5-formyltetrahydrofolate cyclo-ligase [Clostridia bacterium]
MSRLIEEKKRLRAVLKERRSSLTAEQKKEWDRAIVERIAASEQYRRANVILLYAPMSGEIDLLPLVRLARRDGKAVAFPRCDTETCTLRFHLLEAGTRLERGAYGIAEPPEAAPLCKTDENTLCILPAPTFDPTGARLGYGKGYYDRFLESFSGITVGAVYQMMMIKRVPTEAHDKRVLTVFTERGRIRCDEMAKKALSETQNETKETVSDEKKQPSEMISLKRRFSDLLGQWKGKMQHQPQTALTAETGDATGKTGNESAGARRPSRAPHAPAVLVAVTFVLLLLSRLIDTTLADRNNEYVIVILLQLLIFLVPAVVYGYLRGEAFSSRMRIRAPKLKHLWLTACVLVVMISGGLLFGILTGGVSSLTGNFTLYDIFVARSNGTAAQTLYVVLAYGVLPAFCEEMIYRAILCCEYERFGVGVSIAVSAVFFAMLHFSFPLFLSYLLLGAILAGAMYTTRSFVTVFLLHLGYNLFCLFGQPYLSAFYINAGSNEIFIFCLVVLFLLFSAFAVGEARKIYHVYARENADSSYTVSVPVKQLPKSLVSAVLSPACAVCAVIWLVMSIINLF